MADLMRYDEQEAAKPKKLQREEWMLVPPTSSDLLGCTSLILTNVDRKQRVLAAMDPTKLRPRQFRATAAPAVSTSNNLWTETPAEKQQRIADEVSGKKRRAADADVDEDDAQRKLKKRRDEEIRREVEEYNVSLLRMQYSFLYSFASFLFPAQSAGRFSCFPA
jgi:hypothetical protein